MLDNQSVRIKFLLVAAVPAAASVVVALLSLLNSTGPIVAGVSLGGAVVSVVFALLMSGSVRSRLSRLTGSIDGSNQSKPADDEATDEIGDLSRAVAELFMLENRHAADLAISTTNLRETLTAQANRQRELLDSQIERIDWLESTEEDPDRLEQLFQLDHLATRVRRLCESLMVAAGNESVYHRPDPASVADVVRVAAGHNSRYRDIVIHTMDEAMVDGTAACDMSHLLAELLENATRNSPDDTPVEVHATLLDDGSYRVIVIDRGPGMGEPQLDRSRSILADPPEIQLSPDTSIGLTVVGRLARRIGAAVELATSSPSGLTVEVLIPSEVVSPAQRPARPSAAATASSTSEGIGEWSAPAVSRTNDQPLSGRGRPGSATTPGSGAETLVEALAVGDALDSGALGALEGGPSGEQLVEGPIPAALINDGPKGGPAAETQPAPEIQAGSESESEAVDGRAVADELGLTRRKRTAGASSSSAGRPARASSRKPEEVRSMITKYRDGLKAAPKRTGDKAAASDAEGG